MTLDDVVEATGQVDLLKLDIEGAEFPVLEATSDRTLRRIGTIVAELHLLPSDTRHLALFSRLEALGFRVVSMKSPLHSWRRTIWQLLRRWRLTKGLARLKVTVLATYTAAALVSLITDLRARVEPGTRLFVYATRANAREPSHERA